MADLLRAFKTSTRAGSSGVTAAKLAAALRSSGTSSATSLGLPAAALRDRSVKSLGLSELVTAKPIDFGQPSRSSRSGGGASSTRSVTSLLENGLLSFVGGGFGIGSLISGIEGLFGEREKPEPDLVRFALPDSQNRSMSIGQGRDAEISGKPGSSASSNGSPSASSMDSQWFMDHSADIAKAVKDAMLHSNSLNDVISEV